jgi:23S rRNA (cytosine1962-C5)-methyltransferase
MATLVLKPGKEKSILRWHPWIFSGAVESIKGSPQSGETIEIVASSGAFLAWGFYSPTSQITARVWSFYTDGEIGPAFFKSRIEAALRVRERLLSDTTTNAMRLVNAESDGLPGVIIDRYADYLVCQFLTAGAEYLRDTIISSLKEVVSYKGIYERSDVDVREKEGLMPRSGVIEGEIPAEGIEIMENGHRFMVDIVHGHKTGFYLDQRDNRALVGQTAAGMSVLNCFAYTGAFSVYAVKGGAARVVSVESSKSAIQAITRHAALNGINPDKIENIEDDVFKVLRQFRDSRQEFDCIILDPPKFVESKQHIERGSRGYKDINLFAFKLLKPGGFLFTFSCSSLMSTDLFQKIVADAALDAKRRAVIFRRLGQAEDHPTALSFPEGLYLKGLMCRVY